MPATLPARRVALYTLLNVAFVIAVLVLQAVGGVQNARVLYAVLLFGLCSTSVIDLDGLNGRYAVLAIFQATYFVMFGVAAVTAMAQGVSIEPSMAALSPTEIVVLTGEVVVLLSYRLVALRGMGRKSVLSARDWPRSAILLVGLCLWAAGTYATYRWNVYVVTDTTNEAIRKGLKSLGPYATSAYILAQMAQPLGILLIAYLWRVYRPRFIWILVLAICLLQVIVGFIIDIKGFAMFGGILSIVAAMFVDGRVPKLWLAAAVAYVMLVFPIFQAYRTEIHGNRGLARTTVALNLGKVVNLALSASDRVNTGRHRADTFLERVSLLGSVRIIVEKTGTDVPYSDGYTLTPILAAFVPRLVWSDKPDIPTGQLFNKQFHITESDDVFISPSALGEFYWNFGWRGVVAGMAVIGAILGLVGARFNLAQARTLTRLLITVVTIKQLVLGFESAVAPIVVVWLRSLAGIGVLHMIFARTPAREPAVEPAERRLAEDLPPPGGRVAQRFSNLLS